MFCVMQYASVYRVIVTANSEHWEHPDMDHGTKCPSNWIVTSPAPNHSVHGKVSLFLGRCVVLSVVLCSLSGLHHWI